MARDDEYHHRVLGVARNASTPEIRRAYRRLARQHHPDRNAAPDSPVRFGRLAEAYAVLTAPGRRICDDDAIRSPALRDAAGTTPGMLTRRGVLELSPREARLAATMPLALTTQGIAIVLPTGIADGDRLMFSMPDGPAVLTVHVQC